MSLRQRIVGWFCRTNLGEKLVHDHRYRAIFQATVSLCIDLAYAVYHGALGLIGRSWWFIAMWGYHTVMGMARFAVVLAERKNRSAPSADWERFVLLVTGYLLLLLGCVWAGVCYLGITEQAAVRYGEILMITIAAYTFTKLTMAIIRAVRHLSHPSKLLLAVRGIGYAQVAVSVLTLQRSMLVSFGAMDETLIDLMNALTGAGVFLFICTLAMLMLRKGRKGNGKTENCRKSRGSL